MLHRVLIREEDLSIHPEPWLVCPMYGTCTRTCQGDGGSRFLLSGSCPRSTADCEKRARVAARSLRPFRSSRFDPPAFPFLPGDAVLYASAPLHPTAPVGPGALHDGATGASPIAQLRPLIGAAGQRGIRCLFGSLFAPSQPRACFPSVLGRPQTDWPVKLRPDRLRFYDQG